MARAAPGGRQPSMRGAAALPRAATHHSSHVSSDQRPWMGSMAPAAAPASASVAAGAALGAPPTRARPPLRRLRPRRRGARGAQAFPRSLEPRLSRPRAACRRPGRPRTVEAGAGPRDRGLGRFEWGLSGWGRSVRCGRGGLLHGAAPRRPRARPRAARAAGSWGAAAARGRRRPRPATHAARDCACARSPRDAARPAAGLCAGGQRPVARRLCDGHQRRRGRGDAAAPLPHSRHRQAADGPAA
jgi:hypothetical protein